MLRGTTSFLRCLPRKQIALTAEAFAHLLQALGCTAPPSYLEVLANNNGLFHSYSLDDQNSLPGDYCEFVHEPFFLWDSHVLRRFILLLYY